MNLVDWKVLLPIVGSVVALIGFLYTKFTAKKIGRLTSELKLSQESIFKLVEAAGKREAKEVEAYEAKETLNGYTWAEIRKIKEEKNLKSLSDVLQYLSTL